MKLSGKVAIVTGASRGIGKAIAIGFAKQGVEVVVAARTEVEKEGKLPGTIYKTAEEIQHLGQKVVPIKCDITHEEDVQNMIEKVLEHFDHIDILVNNAGTAYYRPLIETPLRRWELVLAVNLTGAFLCSKAVLPSMVKQRCGSIINISSGAANDRLMTIAGVPYAVSKAALERFTWGLASEVGQFNIAVNAVKPVKWIATEGVRSQRPNAGELDWGSPDKMVKSVVFLAAQDGKGVTGVVATDEELCTWHGL